MDISRIATAVVLTLGVPVLAMIQPGARANHDDAAGSRPTVAPNSPEAARVQMTPGREPVAMPGAGALENAIRRLSDQADSVDRLWSAYGEQCGVPHLAGAQRNDFGRAWFLVLDGAKPPAGAHCAQLLELVRQSGEGIRRDLRRALSAARKARVDTGTEVGLLRWHSLELP